MPKRLKDPDSASRGDETHPKTIDRAALPPMPGTSAPLPGSRRTSPAESPRPRTRAWANVRPSWARIRAMTGRWVMAPTGRGILAAHLYGRPARVSGRSRGASCRPARTPRRRADRRLVGPRSFVYRRAFRSPTAAWAIPHAWPADLRVAPAAAVSRPVVLSPVELSIVGAGLECSDVDCLNRPTECRRRIAHRAHSQLRQASTELPRDHHAGHRQASVQGHGLVGR